MPQKAQMHTLEHILNGTMVKIFGCQRAFGAHIEKKKSKCDYHFDRNLTPVECEEIASKVREVVAQNLPVTTTYTTIDDAVKKYSLARLPKNIDNSLRVVHIGDYDHCLCIGDHVENTREIEGFSIISTSWENGVLRIRFRNKNI